MLVTFYKDHMVAVRNTKDRGYIPNIDGDDMINTTGYPTKGEALQYAKTLLDTGKFRPTTKQPTGKTESTDSAYNAEQVEKILNAMGVPHRQVDVMAITKMIRPGLGTLMSSVIPNYVWGHLMGEPSKPSFEDVKTMTLQVMDKLYPSHHPRRVANPTETVEPDALQYPMSALNDAVKKLWRGGRYVIRADENMVTVGLFDTNKPPNRPFNISAVIGDIREWADVNIHPEDMWVESPDVGQKNLVIVSDVFLKDRGRIQKITRDTVMKTPKSVAEDTVKADNEAFTPGNVKDKYYKLPLSAVRFIAKDQGIEDEINFKEPAQARSEVWDLVFQPLIRNNEIDDLIDMCNSYFRVKEAQMKNRTKVDGRILDVTVAKDDNDNPLHGEASQEYVRSLNIPDATHAYPIDIGNDDGQLYVITSGLVGRRVMIDVLDRDYNINARVEQILEPIDVSRKVESVDDILSGKLGVEEAVKGVMSIPSNWRGISGKELCGTPWGKEQLKLARKAAVNARGDSEDLLYQDAEFRTKLDPDTFLVTWWDRQSQNYLTELIKDGASVGNPEYTGHIDDAATAHLWAIGHYPTNKPTEG